MLTMTSSSSRTSSASSASTSCPNHHRFEVMTLFADEQKGNHLNDGFVLEFGREGGREQKKHESEKLAGNYHWPGNINVLDS